MIPTCITDCTLTLLIILLLLGGPWCSGSGFFSEAQTTEQEATTELQGVKQAEATNVGRASSTGTQDPDQYKYDGTLGHNDKCMSDAEKKTELQAAHDFADDTTFTTSTKQQKHDKLLEKLNTESCDINQFLECRLDPDPMKVKQDLNYACLCPDYEKENAVNVNGYYDASRKKCVLRVRAKCTMFDIPATGLRYNGGSYGTAQQRVSDLRHQPTTMPCVRHAHCNVRGSSESDFAVGPETPGVPGYDYNANKCVCDTGYFPEKGQCHKIQKEKLTRSGTYGIFFIIFAFTLFYAVMCFDYDLNVYSDIFGEY